MSVYNYLTQNSKMKKMKGPKTFNWGIPAYKSASGFTTCPKAAACIKGCYAKAGAYVFSNVAKTFERRLELTFNGEVFIKTIDAELKRRNVERLRIHDSGDFYNLQYTMNWFSIMRRNPNVQFYAYTKMISMFKMLQAQPSDFPPNFTVIYSYGGVEDKMINRETDRHSLVFSSVAELKRAGYAAAHINDAVALGINHKIGLVYHGIKNIENTNWDKVKIAA